MLVQKFGGGILATREDFQRVAKIVQTTKPSVVVVSALQGVTDELIAMLQNAKNRKEVTTQLQKLRKKHGKINGELKPLNDIFNELEKTLKGVSYTGEYSDKLYAQVVSRGEYLSALVLQTFLPSYKFWPAENGLIANGGYLNCRCDFKNSKKPPAKSIVTGFYGVNEKGEVCLFGRGGSDYSAGAIARIIGAEKIEFWKNVDGFLTADPKITNNAKFIKELSFEEAAELSRFGAKILHPSSLEPINSMQITVEIKNVLRPNAIGTKIRRQNSKNEIAAITGKKNLAIISVSGNEMVEAFGIASRMLTIVANAGIPVDVIATAQANISFTVDEKDEQKALNALKEMEQFNVTSKNKLALVGIVGSGIKGNPAFIGKVFTALLKQNIKIEMISQGASEIDLSIIVNQKEYENAIQAIHEEFFKT
ncbi:MAG: aspartate kinase [Candidatus Micrarchaeota archaeon]